MKEPWNIPQIWKWVEIKSLGDIVSGGTPSTKEMSYWGDDINWISPADLTGYTKKTIARGAKSLTHQGLAKSSAKLMPAGSIHFSSRAPIGYVAISSQPLSTNQGFKSLVPAQGVFNEYVYYYLKAAKYIAEERASGTTFREISGTAFGKLPFPLPSLPEQNQIVAKIEELFSELDNGIENLKKARGQLKTYRQAVLKYAFEGRFSKEWRTRQIQAGNPPEPAENLLERIRKESEKHYKKQVEDWEKACELANKEGKKKPARPKRPKELPPLTDTELKELPELPRKWEWCKLGDLSYLITKGASPKWQGFKYVTDPTQVLFITSENIRNNYIDIDNPKYLENAFSLKQRNSVLQNGDILLNIVGASIGRAAIYALELSANINQAVSLIRLADQNLKEFISIFLNTSSANKFYNSKKVDFARANLSLADVSNIPIPLCSKMEINFIVSEIESRLSVCDKIEQTIEDSFKKAEALRQSILKKAFEGELTREWRKKHPELIFGENSAEKLLERIKAEKALATGREKSRSKKMKKE
ncbi:MAG TPA: restriction endonuclease subunit S [Desulfatiglandales bacterium]|nr:restriction endonuclease subunit S [Desulfatiglandales bacterium]